MPALAITLNQLTAALLGASAYLHYTSQRGGWQACVTVCGCRIERSSPDPYQAIAQVAEVLYNSEAQQAAQYLVVTPAARAAYRVAWAASEGQHVAARFAAAEAAAASSDEQQASPEDNEVEEAGEAFYEPDPAWAPAGYYDDTEY